MFAKQSPPSQLAVNQKGHLKMLKKKQNKKTTLLYILMFCVQFQNNSIKADSSQLK